MREAAERTGEGPLQAVKEMVQRELAGLRVPKGPPEAAAAAAAAAQRAVAAAAAQRAVAAAAAQRAAAALLQAAAGR